jgi:hypothetical protein
MEEIFKDIDLTAYGGKNYAGYYQISNTAKVKSLKREEWMQRNKCFKIRKEKYLKSFFATYKQVILCKDNKPEIFTLHRLVAIHFIPNPLNLPEVNHKDGDKSNCNDWNLEWTTHSENLKHAYRIGLKKKLVGEKNPNNKLKIEEVHFIKKNKNVYLQRELAKMFNVSRGCVTGILYKKNWKQNKISHRR